MTWLATHAGNIAGLLATIAAILLFIPLMGVRHFRRDLQNHLELIKGTPEESDALSRVQHVESELTKLNTWSLIPALGLLVLSLGFSLFAFGLFG